MPPTPMAASRLMAPVGMAETGMRGPLTPIRMMEPLPCAFSICPMAMFRAFCLSAAISKAAIFRFPW
jgi:hypothetical protein